MAAVARMLVSATPVTFSLPAPGGPPRPRRRPQVLDPHDCVIERVCGAGVASAIDRRLVPILFLVIVIVTVGNVCFGLVTYGGAVSASTFGPHWRWLTQGISGLVMAPASLLVLSYCRISMLYPLVTGCFGEQAVLAGTRPPQAILAHPSS